MVARKVELLGDLGEETLFLYRSQTIIDGRDSLFTFVMNTGDGLPRS